MRLALILAREHGSTEFTTLVEPGNPRVIGDRFKELAQAPGESAELQLWDSHSGMTKRKRFEPSKIPPRADAQASEGKPSDDSTTQNPLEPVPASAPEVQGDVPAEPAPGEDVGPTLPIGDPEPRRRR